ncbi:hypothetical protein CLAFUW4_09532 [Fulvia fulva]|uniref:Uncharacterized protein n=1 Tax=Passalora fulva TaxID=5499 RepID=A0A9Q8UTU4_PASFU|nr:uncharacterized protein CLAFUR5_09628 [Fulvia fulva]KAK4614024.1 hypothetical protein CLAFUR4_09538 [Fulvia fulva]KAK4614671.1 hypothetical protein CLAFUR0_09529 [Fulvia fulva]UJO22241.1 hypothetical protein CLAFUR5_09628 [Fulvia fulva]WPV20297.1 hypothetical protein CLAFUW4_09532 [Fulvia fulva]WPV35718.1 hypothetical protein CLAFUW7_09533 [Fulvia fulva]
MTTGNNTVNNGSTASPMGNGYPGFGAPPSMYGSASYNFSAPGYPSGGYQNGYPQPQGWSNNGNQVGRTTTFSKAIRAADSASQATSSQASTVIYARMIQPQEVGVRGPIDVNLRQDGEPKWIWL